MPGGEGKHKQAVFNSISSIKKRKEDTEPNIILLLIPVTGFWLTKHFKFVRVPQKL
jgi:hypothetical protein